MVGGHATVGRLSNNVFSTFQTIQKFFEKSRWTVTRQWSEVTRLSRPTVKQRFFDVSNNSEIFSEKSRGTVTRQWSEVTRLSSDCQTTFFLRFKQFGKILKKVAERSRDKGRRSRDRWPTVNQRFFDVSNNSENFWKKSPNGHATVVGGHATVGRLSNNVFSTFWTNRKFFEKSRGTVMRQWSEVTRLSADCLTTFFYVSSNSEKFWKKSLNGHATVVGGHATVGRLSNNVFCTFQAIWNFFEKSHWTVTRQWSEVSRPSADCQTTFFGRLKQFEIFLKRVTERSRDSGRRSRDRRLTVKHIYVWIRERERERERGREWLSPLHFIRAPPCCAVGRFISRRPGWG